MSDKYLPLKTFLGVGRPGLEKIDKFPLEGTIIMSFTTIIMSWNTIDSGS